MHEILSTEQPCILCAQPIYVVSVHRDYDTGEERVERTELDHNDVTCLRVLATYQEEWPPCSGN
jgi:hypothetical protein